MKKCIYILLLIEIACLYSCEKFLEPERENIFDEEYLLNKADAVEGLLLRAYVNLPNSYTFYLDVATDDAVTNLKDSQYSRLAKGEWSSSYYPMSQWNLAYQQIFYINKFLELYKSVIYATDPTYSDSINQLKNTLHKKRLKGEAYGLRAWYKLQLLQFHAGKDANGRLLGFPILDKNISSNDNWKLPRNTFAECVASIMTDLDTAIANLPAVYKDGADYVVNKTSGVIFENRINGNAARALKSRVALLAASPAFAEANIVTWSQAATIAGDLLTTLGALSSTGKTFYLDTRHAENIWNLSQQNIRTYEQNNFPPSLYGYGNTNPSQNLVDAFPMKNGYPITESLSLYDSIKPYTGRDTRLGDYIIYDGSSFKSTVINTYIGAPSNGINVLESSTRTGYYLKKFMDPGVTLKPGSIVTRQHSTTLVRVTEVLLNYAEAANEAWGPDEDPNGYGFTARSKIGDLRTRAGITGGDQYLASLDQAGLKELIRNERRLELCFEGFRFWDIRRWGLSTVMNAPVKGVFITKDGSNKTYEYSVVEKRQYESYMIYPPIPYNETLKYNIIQNYGW